MNRDVALSSILKDMNSRNAMYLMVPSGIVQYANPPDDAAKVMDDCDAFVDQNIQSILEMHSGIPRWYEGKRVDVHFYGMPDESERCACISDISECLDFVGLKNIGIDAYEGDPEKLDVVGGEVDYLNTMNNFEKSHSKDQHIDIVFVDYEFRGLPTLQGITGKREGVVLISLPKAMDSSELKSVIYHEIAGELIADIPHCELYIPEYAQPSKCIGGSGSSEIADRYCLKCNYVIEEIVKRLFV